MSESQRTMEEIRESIGEHIAENTRLVAEVQALKEELELVRAESRRWSNAYSECAGVAWKLERY